MVGCQLGSPPSAELHAVTTGLLDDANHSFLKANYYDMVDLCPKSRW